MQKIITLLCVCSTFMLLDVATSNTVSNHLKELHTQYPYGLLGEDYGILNIDDLAMNTCEIIKPEPFSIQSNAYPYWQCFPSKDVYFSCESSGYDEWTKSTPTILVIAVSTQN
ncbi:MAG: hypothetical protein HY072_09790, partial [Deltaproteobacteria bacterium]|nr:hypothetical protein [Deltaproteobacteria bacterium]